MKVLMIIPAYNEEKSILDVVNKIREYRKSSKHHIDYIVINDGSTDNTEQVLCENGIHHISLVENLGIGGAVQTGYMYAKKNNYDIAVQFDGDGQHDIESLEQLIDPVINQSCDFCIGSRFVDKNFNTFKSTKLRRLGIKYFSSLIRLFTKVKVCDPTSGYRAANKKVINLFANDYPSDYPEPESIVQLSKKKFSIREVPVNMFERAEGTSSIGSWKSIYYIIKVSCAIVFVCLQKNK